MEQIAKEVSISGKSMISKLNNNLFSKENKSILKAMSMVLLTIILDLTVI
jgi:hypothetical protein